VLDLTAHQTPHTSSHRLRHPCLYTAQQKLLSLQLQILGCAQLGTLAWVTLRHQLRVIMARIFTRVSFLTTVFVLSIVRNMISPGQGRKSTTWKAIFQHEPWLGVSVVRGCAPSPFLHHHIKEEARRACKPTFVVHQCRPQNPTHWTDLGRHCSGGKPSVTP
jgi:hypothetical protein